MKRFKQLIQKRTPENQEKGQSIVLIALMMVAIIAFVGIAIDVGFIFARGSQLQSAIDSAALAGVTELSTWSTSNTGSEADARTKSAQFLNANNMPFSVTNSINNASNIDISITPLGATQYAVTATWPVETYFLKVLGFREPINLTRSATSAIFSLADIYVSRRVEDGVLSTSNQAVFGPDICINYGDPYSPRNSPFDPDGNLFAYTYRIYIPPNYQHDVVRVELFDPDSINVPANTQTINRSNVAINNGMNAVDSKTCTGQAAKQINPCLLKTDENSLVTGAPNLDIDQVNPFWFVRIDENRGTGTIPGDGTCGNPGNYNEAYNTQTLYSLYYFAQSADGTIQSVPLVSYLGQTGDGTRDNGDHNTDLHWVSPGTAIPFSTVDSPGNAVPALAGPISSFEIDITSDVPNIVVDQSTGARYIYMDVETQSGASENGFEVWAGPPIYVNAVPSEVNARNLYVLNNVGSHSSEGVTVFGLGNLPMNSNAGNAVDIPLLYVGPEMIGQEINVSLFDSDSGAQPPIVFYFDSIGFTPDGSNPLGYDPNATDWAMAFGVTGQDDPDGVAEGVRCRPGSCNSDGTASTGWVDPPYRIIVPGDLSDCDYDNPTMADCTPFVGGRLVARYIGGEGDTYGWQISVEGLPYLVK